MSGEEQTKDVINIDMDYFDNVVLENAGEYSYQRVDDFLPKEIFRDIQSLLLNGDQNQIMLGITDRAWQILKTQRFSFW